MNENNAENTTVTVAIPTPKPKAAHSTSCYAVCSAEGQKPVIVKAKNRTELAKLLSEINLDVLAIFKGKQLTVVEKKTYKFS